MEIYTLHTYSKKAGCFEQDTVQAPEPFDLDAIKKYLPAPSEPAPTSEDDSDQRIRFHSWTKAFTSSGLDDPAWAYISSVDRAFINAHIEFNDDGSQGRTIYILPGLASSESRTKREIFGPASSIAQVHTLTQRVPIGDGQIARKTTCSCDIFAFLNSIRELPQVASQLRFCPHCVLVNLIEDDRESTESVKRHSFQAGFPTLARYK